MARQLIAVAHLAEDSGSVQFLAHKYFWTREKAGSGKCLLDKHKDLSSIPSTHVKVEESWFQKIVL